MKSLRPNKLKSTYLYLIGGSLMLAGIVAGILLGSTRLSIGDIFGVISGRDTTSPEARILIYVRLPRICAALICGAALSVSGAVIQGVLLNRLASPSIIGVNAGAGLAVTLCTALGIMGGFKVSLLAFIGAAVAVSLVSIGAGKWGASKGTVILMGVAMNAFFGAISDTIVTFIPDVSIMSNDFRIGDFSSVTYTKLIPAAIIISLATAILLTLSNELQILTLGDDNARGVGMRTNAMRVIFLMLAALLSGAAVSVAGMISFVGLLVPHTVRRLSGGGRLLLPLSALFGAGFVCACDTLSRVVFAPYEIPVGIIMAFLGAPFFLFVLIKGKGDGANA